MHQSNFHASFEKVFSQLKADETTTKNDGVLRIGIEPRYGLVHVFNSAHCKNPLGIRALRHCCFRPWGKNEIVVLFDVSNFPHAVKNCDGFSLTVNGKNFVSDANVEIESRTESYRILKNQQ